jgi:mutator protein MutT
MDLAKQNKSTVFFAVFGIFYLVSFALLERRDVSVKIIYTPLDDMIPFCEYFVIPYFLWFLYVAVTVIYFILFCKDRKETDRFIYFLCAGMAVFILVSYFWPNGHNLRADAQGDNLFAALVRMLYTVDTSTNIMPSIHVYNTMACSIALLRQEALRKKWYVCAGIGALTVSINLATVFLKQHSLWDGFVALLLSGVFYILVYCVQYQRAESTTPVVEVVAALIWQGDRFMACQRPAHKARGLLWEFVGGKVEPGESKQQALIRECREELAVDLRVGKVFMDVVHAYPDIKVHLTLFEAAIAQGQPQKLEHNDIRWIRPMDIPDYEFCPADEEILKKIIKVDRRRRTRVKKVAAAALLTLCAFIACVVYVGDYYRADVQAISAFMPQHTTWKEDPDGTVVFMPKGADTAMIFYPGGKVEHTAYLPLMQACAEYGIGCILVDMPLRLAVLDMDAAEDVRGDYPQIENWYLGGHSLGGAMAATYLEDHANDYEGLILLAAYSTADLSDTQLDVLSIYGTEDGVMNREKYQDNKENLPDDHTEFVMEGGSHAYFGMYGPQEGDGIPEISNREQIHITAEKIAEFVE